MTANSFTLNVEIRKGEQITACDLLAERSGLSKSKIKDAMIKGAAWLQKKGKKPKQRLRRAKAALHPGDTISLYYNERILTGTPPGQRLISDQGSYTVWHKPAGLMAQGSLYGDHCSLLRQVQLFFNPAREVFLVHRLDREASGLMLVAHDRKAAARLSHLFAVNEIFKQYHVEVAGDLSSKGRHSSITLPLDGKEAVTEFTFTSFAPETLSSTAEVVIKTGRRHQIRRHFHMLGFPVMGDPKYGKGNKNSDGLKLTATILRFQCPFSKRLMSFELPPSF